MRLVLVGPPGAGKGTQAEKLAAHFGIPRITTGDLLRRAVQNKTELGLTVQSILEQGALVPDALVLALMAEKMSQQDCKKGFILDGFPRTVGQAQGLEEWLKKERQILDGVIAISVSDQEALLRNTGRRQCSQCGAAYHIQFQPPRQADRCDRCGGALVQRKDDQEATVRHRLEVYGRETAPLLEFYRKKGLLKKVDGLQRPKEVFAAICSLVK